ncbi:MAG: glutamate 5-kinase [Proteobacteria bacterium]|nr:glutamate 5-kinase [Pseudomonadota bacterium]
MTRAMTPQEKGSIANSKRIVVKIGSVLLVDQKKGTVHQEWLDSLATDVAAWRERGKEIIIVSSGAIALGRRYLGLGTAGLRLQEKQAAAAAGMIRLSHAYQESLGKTGLTVAQVLLTLEDSEDRRRYLNARNTLETLLKLGAIPLINENDTVATDEIRFGDNDRLGARVAAMVSADLLILLSDIDGLYNADPTKNPTAERIERVDEITPEIEAMAGAAGSSDSSGGMVTKLAAAKQCMAAGCNMAITKGGILNPLQTLEDGAPCTWFTARGNPRTERQRWIGGSLQPVGAITVDPGALKALVSGNSLLPAGVSEVSGNFRRGDAVSVRNPEGREIGRGLIAYSADDARLIMGHKTDEIESLLGYRGRDEMIHRDDLVLS